MPGAFLFRRPPSSLLESSPSTPLLASSLPTPIRPLFPTPSHSCPCCPRAKRPLGVFAPPPPRSGRTRGGNCHQVCWTRRTTYKSFPVLPVICPVYVKLLRNISENDAFYEKKRGGYPPSL